MAYILTYLPLACWVLFLLIEINVKLFPWDDDARSVCERVYSPSKRLNHLYPGEMVHIFSHAY